MISAALSLAVVGLVSGVLLLHWFTLAFLSMLLSLAFIIGMRWDLMLIPKWIGLLAALQLAYLGGTALRLWWEDRARVAEGDGESEGILQGERVLIVEDEVLVAAHLADEIEAASGHPVGPARSLSEAFRLMEQEQVDAAVLDVRLLDGEVTPVAMELLARRVPFVIVSAVHPPREILAREPGVPIFRKPFSASSSIRGLAQEISRAAKPRARRAGGG